MNRKSVTRYLPAGMPLHNNFCAKANGISTSADDSSGVKANPNMVIRSHSPPKNMPKNVQFKNKPPEPEKEGEISTATGDMEASSLNTSKQTYSLRRTMRESTVPDQTTPPKTICRSKSIKRDGFNANKYSVNKTKIPVVHSNGVSEREDCKITGALDNGSCSNNRLEKYFKNKRDDSIQRSVQLQQSKSAIQLKRRATSSKKDMIGTTTGGSIETISASAVSRHEKLKLKNTLCSMTDKKQCDCENCDNFISCTTWCDNNINFEKPPIDSVVRKGLPLLHTSCAIEKHINMRKIYKNNILVHGVFIENPVESLKDTCFNENIKKAVIKMNCCSAKTLQSYAWPLIQRRLNVIMVGPPQSGKTLAYLTPICTFAVEKSEKYLELSKYEGPLILILCPNNEKCSQLKKLIDFVIEESWEDMTVENLNDSAAKTNCDILVTMPTTLEEALKSGRVNLKRLCHLVIEDTDLVLKNYHENVGKLLKIVNAIQINRPHKKNIQVIVSTERWTADIEHLMKKLYMSPTIIFKDFLQGAFYSNINFVKKKLNSAHKRFYLEDILKKQYSTHRSIVFCEEFEIAEVQEYLEVKGIECILISNDLIEDEIFENEDMWSSLKMGRYKVLLCTDALFEKTVQILNANWLIHYSLPSDWNTFQKRFRSLSKNFSCSLENENDNHEDTYSFLLGVADNTSEHIFTNFLNTLTISYSKHLQLT